MARKRHKPEAIVTKLRRVEALHGQGKSTDSGRLKPPFSLASAFISAR